ncbi:hypothetical protein [Nocardia tengchongensis]|uniref:hypothetical protein n=1 Tax=Nocardia tengchongensis TaxID=2055889 RepID=UPI00360ED232
MSKVPEITALFWPIKILSMGMGETFSAGFGRVKSLCPLPRSPVSSRRPGDHLWISPWNRDGFAVNLVQRVPVLCLEPGD